MTKKLKRVVAISDISAFGKCSLTISIPVISACGVEVLPLITSILSANTKFQDFVFNDLTTQMEAHIKHWNSLHICADAVYSGYLSSVTQVDLVRNVIAYMKPELTVVDPIMGDHGVYYKKFDSQMCEAIKKLIPLSDIITPNLTEACLLTNSLYKNSKSSPQYIHSIGKELIAMGAKNVILKGIESNGELFNYLITENDITFYKTDLHKFSLFGTGDLFASVLVGKMLSHHSIEESIQIAAAFVYKVMWESLQFEDYGSRGLCFEPFLKELL